MRANRSLPLPVLCSVLLVALTGPSAGQTVVDPCVSFLPYAADPEAIQDLRGEALPGGMEWRSAEDSNCRIISFSTEYAHSTYLCEYARPDREAALASMESSVALFEACADRFPAIVAASRVETDDGGGRYTARWWLPQHRLHVTVGLYAYTRGDAWFYSADFAYVE